MKNKILLICYTLFFFSCHDFDNKIEIIELEKVNVIDQFTDSTFFSDIRSISSQNDTFYLSDYKRNQIIVLDNNLKLNSTIGVAGDGPGEFSGAAEIFIKNDTIYAMNDFKRSIELFNVNGTHLGSIVPNANLSTHKNFIVDKSKIIIPSLSRSNSLANFDMNSADIHLFGDLIPFETETATYIKNDRYLLQLKGKLISISDNKPIIEVYDCDNKKKEFEYSFAENRLVRNKIKFTEKSKQEESSYYELVSDVSLDKNNIYLLLNTYNNSLEKIEANRILKLEFSADGFKEKQILDLGEDVWIKSFSVCKNEILAYDSLNGNLIKYQM